MKKLTLALVVAGFFLTSGGEARTVAPKRIEDLLPADTLLFISLDDITRARAELSKTALGAIWRDEEVQAFLAKPLAQIAKIMRAVEKREDFSFKDMEGLLSGQIALAVIVRPGGPDDFTVAVICAMRITDPGVAASIAREMIKPFGAAGKAITIPGWRGQTATFPNGEATAAVSSDLLVGVWSNAPCDVATDLLEGNSVGEGSLSATESFRHTIARLGKDRIATAYFSVDALREMLLTKMRETMPRKVAQIEGLFDALGVSGLHSVGGSLTVEPPGITQRTYFHAPAPRTGLLALVSEKALRRETLELAPEDVLSFSAETFGFSEVMNVMRAVTGATDASRSLEGLLRMARGRLGFDIENDLLANLGDDVVFAVMSPAVSGGNPLLGGAGGISLVFSMKDPAAIGEVVDKILAMTDMKMRAEGVGAIAETKYRGTTIRYARILGGIIAPSVALVGDRLIITAGLASTKELVRLATKPDGLLVDTDEFKAALSRIGGKVGTTFSYSDTKQTVATALGFANLAGPFLAQMQSRHQRFPRATQCRSNIKQILYACTLWSGDNNEQFPPSLDALSPMYVTDRALFSCPSNPTPRSYKYVSGLSATDPPDWVLIYEPAENHAGTGANVVYIGGRVTWTPNVAALERRVRDQVAMARIKGRVAKVIDADLTPVAGGAAAKEDIDFGAPDDWIDLALLPTPRTLTRHLFPMVSTTTVDDEGSLSMSYGPAGGIGLPSLMGTSGVAVIAAIAIPNLLSSRKASNETVAIAGLRAHLAAQGTFQRVDRYNKGALVYANPDDGRGFTDLYQIGGLGSSNVPMKLIDLAMARATGPATPKAGYYFVDLTGDAFTGRYDYSNACGLCAVPAQYGKSGLNTFVIDLTGTVYRKDNGGKPLTRYPDTTGDDWLPVGF